MPKWKIVSGSRAFYAFEGRDVSIGWARDLARGDEQRTVNVCVANGAEDAADLPDECRVAIRTHGRSVFDAVLDEENPPRIVDVTTAGLVPEYDEDLSAAEPDASTA